MNDSQSVLRLPKELKELVNRYASKINIKPSKLMRDAIKKEIDKLIEIENLIYKLEN